MKDILEMKVIGILKAHLQRWLSNYPAVVSLKKALQAIVIQFRQATIASEKRADHAATLNNLTSFNFFASVYFLSDALRPVHQFHAQLQGEGLILQEIQGQYLHARNQLQRIIDDGFDIHTTPNFIQFVEEVRQKKIDETVIPQLKPDPDTPENRVQRVGDFFRAFIDNIAMVFLENLVTNLDHYFEMANFELLERLERLVVPVILHSLKTLDKFHLDGVNLEQQRESVEEFYEWLKDLNYLANRLRMLESFSESLKREHKSWRTAVIYLQFDAKKKNTPDLSNIKTLYAAVNEHGSLEMECPSHFLLLEALNAAMLTSVAPERGFSWLARFLTKLSQGMGAELVDDCMQIAMNAPPDTEDDGEFCYETVEEFCNEKLRQLDSVNYNDTPNQPPLKKPKKDTPTAKQILCHPSSFANTPAAEVPLPTPNSGSEDTTNCQFLAAAVADSKARKESKDRAKAAAAARAVAAAANHQAAVEKEKEAEETRLSLLSTDERQAEEEVKRESAQTQQALALVRQNMQNQQGTSSVLLMAQGPSPDAALNAMASNRRRSTRNPGPVRLDADEVRRLNEVQMRESRAQATHPSGPQTLKRKRRGQD